MEKSPVAQRLRQRCTCLVDRPPQPPRRFPGTVAHEEAAQAGSVGRSGQPQFGGTRCPGPLAGNPQGGYREQASVLAWRHPFLAGIFWESTSLYQKSAQSATLFVKRTTKQWLDAHRGGVSLGWLLSE